MHPIEHELSAYYDITHGLGLAILMPRYLRRIVDEKSLPRFRNLGIYGMDLSKELSDEEMAEGVARKLEELAFETFQLPSHYRELQIGEENIDEIAGKLASDNGAFTPGYRRWTKEALKELLLACL